MSSVYKNAFLNIAASSATDSSKGFLSSGRELGPIVKLFNQNEKIEFFIHDYTDFHIDVELGALNKRAWVLQERLLSTRTIHFTSGQMYWECGSKVLSESGQPHISNKSRLRDAVAGEEVIELMPYVWYSIVNDFTACKLTEEKDKLFALAGVASKFQERTYQQYCAGLWLGELYKGLLWLKCDQSLLRPITYRAPSWSWASRDGPIQHWFGSRGDAGESLILSDHLGYDVQRMGNTFVERLSLEVCVSVRKAAKFGIYVSERELEKWFLEYQAPCREILEQDTCSVIGWAAFDDENATAANTEIWCAAVCKGHIRKSIREAGFDPDAFYFYYVLLLHKTGRDTHNGITEYERIGLGVIKPEDWFEESLAELISIA